MKRKFSLIVALLLILSTVLSITVSAASYPSLSSTSYCEFTAAKQISVWRNSGCTTRGTSSPAKSYNASISQNDVCYIYKINSSYAQINYPTSSGRKTGYIKTADLLGSGINPSSSFTANSKVNTLKYKNGAASGYYASGDKVYKISGTYYNVMYTAKSGNRAYKLAYTNTNTSTTTSNTATVTYRSHVQDIGWMGWQTNGATSGTTGRNLRIEAFQMKLSGVSGNISYRAHVQDIGWMNTVHNGTTSGTTGRGLRVEAFQVTLSGAVANSYDVVYRAHVQDIGWMNWVSNGQVAGTTGRGLKVEAIQVKLVPKGSTSTGNTTSSTTSSTWQYPMKNAYCTWDTKTDMSWSGYNNRGNSRTDHLGIDIYGTNGIVYAAASGTVVACSSSNSGANGRYIIIQHNLNGKTIYSFYAHLASLNVSKGSPVSKGTQIGVAGGSGSGRNDKYGVHLHFAIVDTLWSSGGYWGYAPSFTGNKKYYDGVTYYNPIYIISNNKLP